MPSKVVVRLLYRHPRTGQLIPPQRAKRFKKRIHPERWLMVLRGPEAGRKAGQIEQAARLTQEEKILPLKDFSEQSVVQTFARSKVYQKLWTNWGGEIRMTVSGESEGRRVKHVMHLAFKRSQWELQTHGKEAFKRFLVGAVLSNLRRRGLRLSGPAHSRGRIEALRRNLAGMSEMMEFTEPEKRGGLVQRMKWAADAIQKQKKSRQLKRATIRIEKLA